MEDKCNEIVHLRLTVPFARKSHAARRATARRHNDGGRSDVENQIVALEKRLWNGDTNDISKLEAEDYEVIKHAHRYHRADDEAAAKEAKFALVSMDDIRVRMLRPDVALMTYHATEKGSFRGTPVPVSLYFGSIWVNRGGEWENVFLEENLPDAFTETYMPRSGSKSGSVLQSASDKSATHDSGELLQIESELLNAYVHRDLSVRDRYVADDFVGVDGAGNIYSKQQDMKDMKDGTFALKSFKEEGVQVRLFGDSAVVTGRNTATSVYKGKEDSFTIRFVDTFLRRDGRWQMVYSQDTNVAESDDGLSTQALAKEREILETLKHNDWSAFSSLLAEDAIAIDEDGIIGKKELIDGIKTAGTVFSDYKMENVKVIPQGNG